MRDTRLILIEGLPGSGKTTTAQKLTGEIVKAGIDCQCFWEWSPNHPIDIGDFEHMSEFIAASPSRDADLIRQWREFANQEASQKRVTVLESRFWQTSVMMMYAAGCPVENILRHNQQVIEAIQDLHPVLIYFASGDAKALLKRTIEIKNAEWEQEKREESWAERIYAILKPQAWFAGRDVHEMADMGQFFEEWCEVAESLYAQTPFAKIKIHEPYRDWNQATRELRVFLEMDKQNAR